MPTPRGWTSEAERLWFEELWKDFNESRVNNHSTAWMTGTQLAYFNRFHPDVEIPANSDESKIFFTGLKADANGQFPRVSVAQRMKQVYWWFWNCADGVDLKGRGKGKGKGKKKDGGLDLNATPKKAVKRQAYQAYVDICGERVLPIIKEKFREYLKTVPEGEKPDDWVKFMGERAKAMLAEEPADVQKQVEDARLKGPKETGLEIFTEAAASSVTAQQQEERAMLIQEAQHE
ncbi:hypothetical protein L226DRAFT_576900 [Lentinus tigrinus ALCF2SS1-7]|uniref:Uncharacterized protein n=1 Tax=Lentinus tigrinus ALCF2SS1-6 TaxID=1328759 RepID=A0A5C2RLG2_9APHY|nr:hypothetical protein L227DRAFT_617856 [Lentinus tigrinus ALCF2SS1-6]RPD67864.1 hypothetical protein L226DRAFT_576900 [Lentinus tigrinus ALCF2SS1-7]